MTARLNRGQNCKVVAPLRWERDRSEPLPRAPWARLSFAYKRRPKDDKQISDQGYFRRLDFNAIVRELGGDYIDFP